VNPQANLARLLAGARDNSTAPLGSLETEVMELIWRNGAMSVRDVHERFAGRLAYTTLMTTLDRLYKKSLLDRTKQGRAFVYQARVNRGQFEEGLAAGLFGELLQRNASQPAPLLSCFVDAVSERDRQLLDELDRMIQEKRRTLNVREKSGEK